MQGKDELISCPICGESDKLWEEICYCVEGHLVCRSCLKDAVNHALSISKPRIDCLTESDCPGNRYSNETLRLVLSKKKYKMLEELNTFNDLRLANLPGLLQCPFCIYAVYIQDNQQGIKPNTGIFTGINIGPGTIQNKKPTELQCQNPLCMKRSCTLCNQIAHKKGELCKALKTSDAENDLKKCVELAVSESIIRQCRKCRTQIMKDKGCNQIRCSVCEYNMCYCCDTIINQDNPSTHYSDPGVKCIQYTDQEQDDKISMQRAAEKAVVNWLENHPDQGNIRLVIQGMVIENISQITKKQSK
ncbi:MAG: hypothetical protein EZS28_004394 [Streblomastix strix]|uniref:RING-type domain-containing protein n=1 Tax=Streblomastix strix TaxID=222440 RepID=A0A5J4WZW6_9EUKA|nr:MAG: hypothetical protein EZS28_004394 [Streblomastix strix]